MAKPELRVRADSSDRDRRSTDPLIGRLNYNPLQIVVETMRTEGACASAPVGCNPRSTLATAHARPRFYDIGNNLYTVNRPAPAVQRRASNGRANADGPSHRSRQRRHLAHRSDSRQLSGPDNG